jgi:hypothetical protein
MIQEHLQENKPSQNDHFSHKVRFFLALKTIDMRQVETLVQRDPDLIHAQTEGVWAPRAIFCLSDLQGCIGRQPRETNRCRRSCCPAALT